MDWHFYVIPLIISCCVLMIYCYFFERQIVYFRISSDNLLDIEYSDYVSNTPFFDIVNRHLEPYLVLYVKEHFYSLDIPHQYVKVAANISFEQVSIACYLEITRKQQRLVQRETLSGVNIAQEIQKFYRFLYMIKEPKYEHITKVKEIGRHQYFN